MNEILYVVSIELLKFIDVNKLFPGVFSIMLYRIPYTDKVEISAFIEN